MYADGTKLPLIFLQVFLTLMSVIQFVNLHIQ